MDGGRGGSERGKEGVRRREGGSKGMVGREGTRMGEREWR